MVDFNVKAEELRRKADDMLIIADIIEKIRGLQRWDFADFHEKDDEHEEAWFTRPVVEEEGDFYNERRLHGYDLCDRVIEVIEKWATK